MFILDLLTCTNNEMMNLTYMAEMLLERCGMSTWVIVSKALVTFHSLMSNGNEVGEGFVIGNYTSVVVSVYSCQHLCDFGKVLS